MLQQQLAIQDETMFSEEEARSSMRQRLYNKTRLLHRVTQRPKYNFTATCTGIPREVQAGQRLQFTITIHPTLNPLSSPLASQPDISLDSCILTLIAQPEGAPAAQIEVLRQKQQSQLPAGPFATEYGLSKTVDLGVLGHVPSAHNFDFHVRPTHRLRLELQFHVAGAARRVSMRREFQVHVHASSAAASRNNSCAVAAAPSSWDHELLPQRLPSYDEVMAISKSTARDTIRTVPTPQQDEGRE